MSTTRSEGPAAAAIAESDPELAAAIEKLPAFIRWPIFLPTERVPTREAIAGLERVAALYDGGLDVTHRPRLRALKRARTGRRCFVIGNGPSLASTDLSKLRSEATFATNGFFLKMPELDWSPTYYVVEDHLVGEDRAAEIRALSGTTKLFPASLAYALSADDETIYFDHRPRKSYPDGFDFSFDADVNTWTGGTVTFTCMQLAAYLGYQEIYLIGVDADYSIPADAAMSGGGRVKEIDMRSDDPNHFHPDYFGKGKRWHEPNVETMLGAYAEARRATEARGVSIANATVGGKLEAFSRIDFEMLFRPVPAERMLVIDHTQVGDATATGQVKAAVLGNWPRDNLMQLYDRARGQLRIAGDPLEVGDAGALQGRIATFGPDLILYRPVPRKDALHDFAMELIAGTGLPLALWIVDDWPAAYAREDPDAAARLEKDLQWLLQRADACFSISPAMSEAFHERYGRLFVPIANGVDPADWPPAQARSAAHMKVRYAGSLAENMTLTSVGLVARVVEKLADAGLDISFEIKTHRHWRAASAEWMADLRHTSVSTSDLTMADYRRWLVDADVLLIAYNFDARSRDYIRYSLANKLPECLASGAAVLAVGPDDVGTIATMAALDVGERITTPDEELIGDTLRRLAASPERRLELAQRSQSIAFSLFAVGRAQQAFEASVGRVAAAHHAGDYPRDLHAHVDETAVVARLMEDRHGPDHVMVDVGAHSGSSAIHFDRLGWTVRCFEPNAASRGALAARFAKHENIRIDPRAVSDAPATDVPLYESPESSGIAALTPFLPSHRPAGHVDVTTIAEVAREVDLAKVDFLKIDVEGHDLAVLRGVPWSQLRPDVVECEFEDAKTTPLGHSWRDMAAYLQEQGYTVYVSEWHPVVRYGTRHDWRRVEPLTKEFDVRPGAWGNFVAFQDDPGWPRVREAFDRLVQRGQLRAAPPPSRTRETLHAEQRTVVPVEAPPAPPPRPRPIYGPFSQWLKPRAPALHRVLRLSHRGARHLWQRRAWTVPTAAVLALWVLLGFVPGLASLAWLIWGSAALSMVALGSLYATWRVRRSTKRLSRQLTTLQKAQTAHHRTASQANAKIAGLERALADLATANADFQRQLTQLGVQRAEDRVEGRTSPMEATTPFLAQAGQAVERPGATTAERTASPNGTPGAPPIAASNAPPPPTESAPEPSPHLPDSDHAPAPTRPAQRLGTFRLLKPGRKAPAKSARKAPSKRSAHGHALLIDLLPRLLPAARSDGFLIEVGTTREKIEGQGSTVELAKLARQLDLAFVTVDMDPVNTDQARVDLAQFRRAEAVTARGEDFLSEFDGPVVAAYLDAFDIQHGLHSQYRVDRYRELLDTEITNEAASEMHHACAEALIPNMVEGGLIVIDDTWREGEVYVGKGATAVPLLLDRGFRVVGSTRTAVGLQRGPGRKG